MKNKKDTHMTGQQLEYNFIKQAGKYFDVQDMTGTELDKNEGTDAIINGIRVDFTTDFANKDHINKKDANYITFEGSEYIRYEYAIRTGNNSGYIFPESVLVIGVNDTSGDFLRDSDWAVEAFYKRIPDIINAGLDYMEEYKQIELVRNNPFEIQNIESPSEKVCIAAIRAVEKDNVPKILSMIKGPSRNTKRDAIKKNFLTYEKIVNPTKTDQLEAVKQNPGAIRLVKNPHKETIRYIYNKEPDSKKYLISLFGNEFVENALKKPERTEEPVRSEKLKGVCAVPDWIH